MQETVELKSSKNENILLGRRTRPFDQIHQLQNPLEHQTEKFRVRGKVSSRIRNQLKFKHFLKLCMQKQMLGVLNLHEIWSFFNLLWFPHWPSWSVIISLGIFVEVLFQHGLIYADFLFQSFMRGNTEWTELFSRMINSNSNSIFWIFLNRYSTKDTLRISFWKVKVLNRQTSATLWWRNKRTESKAGIKTCTAKISKFTKKRRIIVRSFIISLFWLQRFFKLYCSRINNRKFKCRKDWHGVVQS